MVFFLILLEHVLKIFIPSLKYFGFILVIKVVYDLAFSTFFTQLLDKVILVFIVSSLLLFLNELVFLTFDLVLHVFDSHDFTLVKLCALVLVGD